MNQTITSLINPATRNENDLAFTVKRWTKYMEGEPFNAEDIDAANIAYNRLCRWMIVNGDRKQVDSMEYAQLSLIDVNLGSTEDMLSVFADENKEALLIHGFGWPVFRIATDIPMSRLVENAEKPVEKQTKRRKQHKTVISKTLFDAGPDTTDYRCVSTPKDVSTGHTRNCPNGHDHHTWKTKTPVGPMPVDFSVDNYDEYMVCYDHNGQAAPMMYHVDPAGEFNGFSPCAKASGNPANPYNVACSNDYKNIMDIDNVGLCMLKRYKSMFLKNGSKNK